MKSAECSDGQHVWGPPDLMVSDRGPMEGDWIRECCLRCGTFSLKLADGGDGALDAILAALTAKGCEPEPVGDPYRGGARPDPRATR